MKLIEDFHYMTFADYDAIAPYFDRKSIPEICEALFDFCKENLDYVEESSEDQNVIYPRVLLKRGYCDCKGYAGFIAGVLDALCRRGKNIRWCYRFASYKFFETIPGHVFVVVKMPHGREIWIDPVLGSFDFRKKYWSAQDLTTELTYNKTAKNVAGIGRVGDCNSSIGLSTSDIQQGAQLLSATAPALALIPGAGPFIAVGAQLVGLFASMLPNYQSSEGVRWLTHAYQENVLGQNIDFKQVNEALTDDSHKWFNAVLGVPVYDKFRLHTLMGTDPNTGNRLNPLPTDSDRAKQYLTYHEAQAAAIPYDDALDAARIAGKMPLQASVTTIYGAWKNLPISTRFVNKLNSQAPSLSAGSELVPGSGISKNWIWIAAGVGAIFLIMKMK